MASKKADKRNWIVTARCVVIKEICVSNCTEEEARDNPYNNCTEEREVSQDDWEVIEVTENT